MEEGCALLTQLTAMKLAGGSGKQHQRHETWFWLHTARCLDDQILGDFIQDKQG